MDDESPPLIAPDPRTDPRSAAERSLVDDVKQLAQDGRTLLEAELAYQKSRAMVVGEGVKGIAGWGALALALVFFALMALILGLLLALSAELGPWAALAIVFGGVLIAAGLAAWTASRRWKRMAAHLTAKDPQQ